MALSFYFFSPYSEYRSLSHVPICLFLMAFILVFLWLLFLIFSHILLCLLLLCATFALTQKNLHAVRHTTGHVKQQPAPTCRQQNVYQGTIYIFALPLSYV